jgi:L-threonylcarbamoyladenylate synthase
MILYPTETTYGIGVNPLDVTALERLYAVKGRDAKKAVSWLVRDVADIERYAVLSVTAAKIAERFLPGPLTLVLPSREPDAVGFGEMSDRVGFRVSPDPLATALIRRVMSETDAPLTATSANKSGMPTGATVADILAQFGDDVQEFSEIIDGGVRTGTPSTVVGVFGSVVEVYREGVIPSDEILGVL